MRQAAILVIALIVLSGCSDGGPAFGTVTGTVTMDGNPLPGVQVYFQPEQGRPSLGFTDSSGVYELEYSIQRQGALVGRHIVSILPPEGEEGGISAKDVAAIRKMLLPRYNSKTELTADVKSGKNTIDFSLTSSR